MKMQLKTRLMLIVFSLLLITSGDAFARTIDTESPDFTVIKQAASDYAVVLSSESRIDGYSFEKNILRVKTKRANIAQEVSIALPDTVQVVSCEIVGNTLKVKYKESVDISSDVTSAENKGKIEGGVVGAAGGFILGVLTAAVIAIAL